jgi:small subunit ribosomal protein S8
MSMQDPIADLFSRINNAQSRRKSSVVVPSSKKKISLLSLLKDKGYIDSYDVSDSSKPEIEIKLKYFEGAPVIKELKRISKPGLRQYSSNTQLPEVNGGLGIAIISTNQGLMTDAEAKEAGLGGELICSVF